VDKTENDRGVADTFY